MSTSTTIITTTTEIRTTPVPSSSSTSLLEPPPREPTPVINFSRLVRRNTGESGTSEDAANNDNISFKTAKTLPDSLPLPDEPRFSDDSSSPDIEEINHSCSTTELLRLNERSQSRQGPPLNLKQQRHTRPPVQRTSSSQSHVSRTRTPENISKQKPGPPPTPPPSRPLPNTPTPTPPPRPSILKHTTIEQTVERASSSNDDNKDNSNNKDDDDEKAVGTGSETSARSGSYKNDSGRRSQANNVEFCASDYDTSQLSKREIRRLERKGINPALYLEMRAIRKGKGCVGALTGNTYVS